MKTKKIVLIAVMLMLVFSLASCSANGPDCFSFEEAEYLDDVYQLDGEVISYNTAHNIIALSKVSLTDYNEIRETITVMDLAKNSAVYTKTISSDSGSVSVDVSCYPVIKVTTASDSTDSNGDPTTIYRYDYFTVGEEDGSNELVTNEEEDTLAITEAANLYIIKIGDMVWYADQDGEILHSGASLVPDSYGAYFNVLGEYNGYLYTWEMNEISQLLQIYGPDSVCCAQYKFSQGTLFGIDEVAPTISILNNGSVLVQECIGVEDGEEYDFVYTTMLQTLKVKLSTKVLDLGGNVIELNCDFRIYDVESAYSRDENQSAFAFTLSDGNANQAYISYIKDGLVEDALYYVVMEDDLDITYTLENPILAELGDYTIIDADAEKYTARAYVNHTLCLCDFDYAGKLIRQYPINASDSYRGSVFGDVYMTGDAVYSADGKLIFDLGASKYKGTNARLYAIDEQIYVNAYNAETACYEVYRLNTEDGTLSLVADGKVSWFDNGMSRNGILVVEDTEKGVTTVYNLKFEAMLIVATDDIRDISACDGLVAVEANVDGKSLVYVIRNAVAKEEGETANEEN